MIGRPFCRPCPDLRFRKTRPLLSVPSHQPRRPVGATPGALQRRARWAGLPGCTPTRGRHTPSAAVCVVPHLAAYHGCLWGGARYARGRFEEMGGLFGKVYNLDKEGGEKEGEGPHTPPPLLSFPFKAGEGNETHTVKLAPRMKGRIFPLGGTQDRGTQDT